jgi:tetratricopeptide (TPR) repeat protein
MRPLAAFLLMALAAAPAHARPDAAWRALPARAPADSVMTVLLGWEQRGGPGVRAGEAGYALGQFRYARGEYEPAAAAFLRAAARLDGDDRAAARYGWALATFALGHATAARPVFEEVSRSNASVRPLALLGSAQCWEAEGRPERALDTLQRLLAGEAGEAAPAALERCAALAERLHRGRDADEARRRLVRQYPHSMEAARAQRTPVPSIRRPFAGQRLETGGTPARSRLP